jgi:hypothetical protein
MAIKLIKNLSILIMVLYCASCRLPDNLGFYQPITLRMTVPDGPPEFKAGWQAGCKTALGMGKNFANAWVYGGADFGSGVYQHDPVYQSAWSTAYFNCVTHAMDFTEYHSMMKGPLE